MLPACLTRAPPLCPTLLILSQQPRALVHLDDGLAVPLDHGPARVAVDFEVRAPRRGLNHVNESPKFRQARVLGGGDGTARHGKPESVAKKMTVSEMKREKKKRRREVRLGGGGGGQSEYRFRIFRVRGSGANVI